VAGGSEEINTYKILRRRLMAVILIRRWMMWMRRMRVLIVMLRMWNMKPMP
jgi:hypothetical protein